MSRYGNIWWWEKNMKITKVSTAVVAMGIATVLVQNVQNVQNLIV